MNEAPSQAKYLFERYSGVGAVDLLKSLPALAEKTFENDWLDFKTGKTRDEDIKRIWSKVIGAFANNEGGVIIWGLVSKKDPKTGIDAVHSIELAPDVFALKSRLMELRHGAADPPIANIEIKELPIASNSPEGFVVCYVPESNSKPHRSEFCEKRFYIRMGDSSRESSVSLLRQLFYPKRNPRIQVEVKVNPIPRGLYLTMSQASRPQQQQQRENHVRSAVEVGIRNIGEISIDEVYARLSCDNFKLISYSYNDYKHDFDIEFAPPVIKIASVIHPSLCNVLAVALVSDIPQVPSDLKIQIYSRDMMPRKATLSIGSKEGDSTKAECFP